MCEIEMPKFYILQQYCPTHPNANEDGCLNIFYVNDNKANINGKSLSIVCYNNEIKNMAHFKTIGEAIITAARLYNETMKLWKCIPVYNENIFNK